MPVESTKPPGHLTKGYQPTKYDMLVAERNQLKTVLDRFSNMKRSHNYKAVRVKYDLVVKQIKQLFHTHA